MSVVSDIEIRLRADIARLQQDMTQARQTVASAMTGIRNAVNSAGVGIAALAAGLSVGAFAGWIKGAIDAVDAIGDISPATGVAIKDIAGLQLAFQFGGLEAQAMEATMIKLSKAIAGNDESIVSLGVKTRTATGSMRESKDVLYDLADAFADMQDGTQKTALAVDVFGKSGAALIPMLNNGSQGLREMAEMAEKLGLTFTEEGVEAAGQFNDTLDFLGLAAQGVARQVGLQLLPTLNSLSGSMLNLVVQGDGVRKVADVIGAGFKVIFTGAVAVGQAFDTVSSIIALNVGLILDGFGTIGKTLKLFIEGEYRQAWEAATSGAARTVGNAKNLAGDMMRSWEASGKAIGAVWTETGGETVAAMAAMAAEAKRAAAAAKEKEEADKKAAAAASKAARDAEKLAEQQRRAAERDEQAYQGLLEAVQDRIDATAREAAGLAPLTEAQKLHRDLDKQLLSGKINLTAEQIRYYRALIDTVGVNEDVIESNKEQVKQAEEMARIQKEAAEQQEAAARRAADAQREFWSSIDKTAHDTFVSITEGGKGAAERLKDTFKNIFFDWLYQQTLKKWIIQLQPTAAGGGGLLDAAQNAFNGSGGGASGLMQAGKAIYEGFAKNLSSSFGTLMSKAGEMFGSKALQSMGSAASASSTAGPIAGAIIAGMMANNKFFSEGWSIDGQVTDIIKSQMKSSLNGNIFGPIVSVMTASMNVFEKAMSRLGVNAKFASMISGSAVFARAFGRKAPTIESQGIQGTIGAGGFTGEAFANILQKGGWFRSDKRSVSTQALDAGQEAAFDNTVKSVVDSVREMGAMLGLEASRIDGYSKQIKLTLGADEAANQKLIEEAFGGLADDLAALMLPTVSTFAKSGETASAALARVATNFQALNSFLDVFSVTSQQAFGAVGAASIEARERVINLAGGLESFVSQADFFAQNFLTAEQQIAPVQKRVTEGLAALGYAGVDTVEEFRAAVMGLVESGKLATAEGAKTYAGLLALAPAFKQLTDYLEKTGQAAKDAAEALDTANQVAADAMQNLVDGALAGLQRAIDAEKNDITLAFNQTMDGMSAAIDNINKSISATRSLSEALAQSLGDMAAPGSAGASRAAAQAQIEQALRVAQRTGVLPDAEDLRPVLATLTQDATNQFGSYTEYVRDMARTASTIAQLGAITDSQLTLQEQQLAAAVSMQEQLKEAYEAQITKLEQQLDTAREQVNLLRGIDTGVQSVAVALGNLRGALAGAAAPPVVGADGSATGLTVDQLYRNVLGREAEAAGKAFWETAFGSVVDASELAEFLKGAAPELQARANMSTPSWLTTGYSSQQSGTMQADKMITALENIEKRMANVESSTGKFADQFENATGGGGPILTKAAK